ncbi:CLUMA_CG002091, isoform A [Clunio marinus]|uniref:CLUMA_CG002091, isoform A n=1 Tax=Clunio marinus TaxID=568069 RepID=A0A1J1HJS5_9DIPT|nr:CLUMA_CG002091, isoform A [Clunio marinus]
MRHFLVFIFYFILLRSLSVQGLTSDYIKKNILKNHYGSKQLGRVLHTNDELCDGQLTLYNEAFDALFDLWSKMQSGILQGNIYNIGHFTECVRFRHDTQQTNTGVIQGQHCLIVMSGFQTNITEDRSNWQDIGSIIGLTNVSLINGYCLPASCSNEKALDYVNTFLVQANLAGVESYCRTNDSLPFTAVDIFAIVLFSIFGFLLITSTTYDVVMRRRETEPNKLLIAFSINTNGKELFDVTESKSPNAIKCLLGLRTLSLFWIILGHRFEYQRLFPNANTVTFLEHYDHFYIALHTAFNIAVDTFFVMGSLLATTSILNALDKRRLNIPRLILHRYLRYTPVLAALVLFTASLSRFFITGPFGEDIEVVNCQNYWWSTLLHIQNYVNPTQLCVGHSWYLSVDFQLFILTPFLIYPAWRWGWKYLWSLLLLGLVSSIAAFLVYYFVEPIGWFEAGYVPTHTRAAPWMIGMTLAYILFTYRNKKIKISKKLNCFGWILALTTRMVGRKSFGHSGF